MNSTLHVIKRVNKKRSRGVLTSQRIEQVLSECVTKKGVQKNGVSFDISCAFCYPKTSNELITYEMTVDDANHEHFMIYSQKTPASPLKETFNTKTRGHLANNPVEVYGWVLSLLKEKEYPFYHCLNEPMCHAIASETAYGDLTEVFQASIHNVQDATLLKNCKMPDEKDQEVNQQKFSTSCPSFKLL